MEKLVHGSFFCWSFPFASPVMQLSNIHGTSRDPYFKWWGFPCWSAHFLSSSISADGQVWIFVHKSLYIDTFRIFCLQFPHCEHGRELEAFSGNFRRLFSVSADVQCEFGSWQTESGKTHTMSAVTRSANCTSEGCRLTPEVSERLFAWIDEVCELWPSAGYSLLRSNLRSFIHDF